MGASLFGPGGFINVDVNGTLASQSFVATSLQTNFTLTNFSFVVGTGSIFVFHNGLKLTLGIDYSEVNSTTISLNSGATVGDSIDIVGFPMLNLISVGAGLVMYQQPGVGGLVRAIAALISDQGINPKNFGAIGDCVNIDGPIIQRTINFAASMFNQVGFPPAGAPYTPATVKLGSGAFLITDPIKLYNGMTLCGLEGLAYTVEGTRIVMLTALTVDGLGGAVNMSKNIIEPTLIFQGSPRGNNVTVNIHDIGFWIQNPGSTLNARGGAAFPADSTTGLGTAGTGCAIAFLEPTIDSRIHHNNFSTVPFAAVKFQQSNNTIPSDAILYQNEYDTSVVAVFIQSGHLNIIDNDNKSYSGSYYIHNDSDSAGSYKLRGSDTELRSRIKFVSTVGYDYIRITDLATDGAGNLGSSITINKCLDVHLSDNTIRVSANSGLELIDIDDGLVSDNEIINAGFSTSLTTPPNAAAGIYMKGCLNVSVVSNVLPTPASGTFGGMGIFSVNNGGRIAKNQFALNRISSKYNGGIYRGQPRTLNVEPVTDVITGVNELIDYGSAVPERRVLDSKIGKIIFIPTSVQMASGTIDALLLNGLAFTEILIHASMVSSGENFIFRVGIKRPNFPLNPSYVIAYIVKDEVVGSGPFVLASPNTINFTVFNDGSGNQYFRITFVISTDQIVWSMHSSGPKF